MDAKSQVQEFERVLNKIFQAYRIRLNLMVRRNKILSDISKNKMMITPELEKSLLNVLEKEKKVINIILNEDQVGRNNIDTALATLKKVRVESSILAELKRRNINYSDLKKTAEIGLKILSKMIKRLRHIEERIVVEERLIARPTPKNFENYVYLWRSEVREEEKFRKFIHRQPTQPLSRLTRFGILTTVASFGGMLAQSHFIQPYDINMITMIPFAIGLVIVLSKGVFSFINMIEQNQKYIDFQSEDILKAMKSQLKTVRSSA